MKHLPVTSPAPNDSKNAVNITEHRLGSGGWFQLSLTHCTSLSLLPSLHLQLNGIPSTDVETNTEKVGDTKTLFRTKLNMQFYIETKLNEKGMTKTLYGDEKNTIST